MNRPRLADLGLLALLLPLICACTTSPARGTDPTLAHWLDAVLIPHVVRQASEHPRFRNQPLQVVGLRDGKVRARMDNLSRYIRGKLVMALAGTPHVKLVDYPIANGHRAGDAPAGAACTEPRTPAYYIGIDAMESPVDGALEVSVRALDVRQHRWFPGFERTWRGSLPRAQERALAHLQPDESLRGLRALPFTDAQPDRLAGTLARHIGCRLSYTDTGASVYLQPPKAPAAFFRTSQALLAEDLADFPDLERVATASRADVVLQTHARAIHGGLYQVRVTVHDRSTGHRLPGAAAQAYVQLDQADAAGMAAVESRAKRPAGASQAADRPPGASRTPWDLPAGAARAQDTTASPADRGRAADGPLIDTFDILRPARPAMCATANPWQWGEQTLAAGDSLPNGACLAARIEVNRPARLFFLEQTSDGRLQPFAPSMCDRNPQRGYALNAGRFLRYPPNRRQTQVLVHDNAPGSIWLYAIAVSRAVPPDLSRRLTGLVTAPLKLCNRHQSYRVAPPAWQAYLNDLTRASHGHLEWRMYRFRKQAI